MYLDFHTHGKLAKYLPFSIAYTNWLLNEAKNSGLDAICLTEHFNTQQFDKVYSYIATAGEALGDCFVFRGLKVFPGMETDIAEGGHVLSIGPMDVIRELNRRLEPYKQKGHFLPFAQLIKLFREYPVLVGAGHPFRAGGNIPSLPKELLEQFDFLDLNGKDIAENQERTESMTYQLGKKLQKPVIAESDTHQAVQYGCIRTCFEKDCSTFEELYHEMLLGHYSICIHPEASFKVKTASLLKRSLKEIHALGRDYVSVLLGGEEESPAVIAAKQLSCQNRKAV